VTDHKHRPEERDISGFPEGTRIIHNPTQTDFDSHVGAAEGSDLLGRHGRRFQLIEGSKRTAIEVIHFVERGKGFFRKKELVLDRSVYVLPEGTSLDEARRIGYRLVHEVHRSLPPIS
jgi:hypothetical protein